MIRQNVELWFTAHFDNIVDPFASHFLPLDIIFMHARSVHPFTMRVTEMGTEAELLTVERPCACAAAGCKFCCFQTAKYTSGGNEIGSIRETCYCCVPSFRIANGSGQDLFFLHPPTCCCGMCIHCCTEGNPCCGSGVCKVPFWIFDAADDDDDDDGKDSPSHRHRRRRRPNTNGSGAAHIGKILKKPKSTVTELFTDASAFEVHFPVAATVEQKAVLVGTAIFLNAVFFEDAGF